MGKAGEIHKRARGSILSSRAKRETVNADLLRPGGRHSSVASTLTDRLLHPALMKLVASFEA